MDTNKKILIDATNIAVVIGGVVVSLILGQASEKTSLSIIHTETTIESPKETLPPATETETETATPTENDDTSSVTAKIETYTSGKVSIQYPAMNRMNDANKQAKVNELLKSSALSVIKANEVDESKDTLSVKCKIISVDHKRITVTYTGSLMGDGVTHPINLFYSNTINLPQVQDLGFEGFTDAYTMAGYVLSDDVRLSSISADVGAAVLECRSSLGIDALTAMFNDADSPLSSGIAWPESFSHEKQGTISFSMSAPRALGDYVIVSFDPSTK